MRLLAIVLCLLAVPGVGQQIVQGEYFWDEDPGVGNGFAISVASGDEVTGFVEISSTGVESGVHILGIRFLDETNRWSHVEKHTVMVDDLDVHELIAAEYWWDVDPGEGQANAFPVTQGVEVTGNLELNPSGLEAGLHRVGIRFKDELGHWTHSEISLEMIENSLIHLVTEAEYFWNTDPGVGNGTDIDIDSMAELEEEVQVNNYGLPLGDHWLHIRVKDEDGHWSHYHRELITVCETWGAQSNWDFEFDNGTFTMTNQSAYQDSIQWFVNGVASGNEETLVITPTEATEICLEAINGCGTTQLCDFIGIPLLTSVDPNILPNDQLQTTILHGFLFDAGSDVSIEKDGEIIDAASVIFDDSTQLTAYFEFDNETLGLWDVVVTLENGDELLLEEALALEQFVGISAEHSTGMSVYPNPAGNNVNIELDCTACIGPIRIHDASGRLVAALSSNKAVQQISTANWNAGMYSISILTDQGIISTRLLVSH